MKTKEITCFMSEIDFSDFREGKAFTLRTVERMNHHKIKVTVIVPVREVVITEDDFENAWSECSGTSWTKLKESLRQKLFRKDTHSDER